MNNQARWNKSMEFINKNKGRASWSYLGMALTNCRRNNMHRMQATAYTLNIWNAGEWIPESTFDLRYLPKPRAYYSFNTPSMPQNSFSIFNNLTAQAIKLSNIIYPNGIKTCAITTSRYTILIICPMANGWR